MNFFEKMLEVAKSMGVKNFAYYKKWAIEHLKKQIDEDEQIQAFNELMEGRSKADNARTEIAKRSLEIDNNRLMERLNAEDRKEMKSEFEKHQNRSNAMKGNDNAKKDGISDEELKKMTNFQLRKRLNELENQEGNVDYKKLQDELNKREKEEDLKDLQANVDGIKNKLEGKSEAEVKKYFNWLDKQFADKPEDSVEKRAIKQAKDDYYGNTSFNGTELETVVEKYASDKDIKNLVKKIDSMSLTSNDETKAFMSGTYQEDGYQVATDGHMLSMIKTDYPKEDEKKIKGNDNILKYIGKKIENLKSRLPEAENKLDKVSKEQGTGSKLYEMVNQEMEDIKKEIGDLEEQKKTGAIKGTYPNYKKVIPSLGNANLITQEGFEDFDKVLKTAMVAAAYKKQTKSFIAVVRVGDKVFDAEKLIKVMAMAKKHGLKDIVTTSGEGKSVEFKGDNGSIVIMPMTRADEKRDGEFDSNTGTVNIEDKDKAEEFLTGGENETRLTFAKNKSKYETKFDKDIIDIMNHFEKQKGLTVSKYYKDHNYIRTAKNPAHVSNEGNEDFKNAMNDLKDLYQDYQGFITDVYNRRFEEGKENKNVSSKEIKKFFEDGVKKIKDKYGVQKSFLEQIEEISKSSNRSHLVKKQVTDKNGRVRTVWVNPLDKEQMKKRKADIADLRDFTGKEKEKAIIEDAIKEVLGGEIEKMRNIDFPKDASKNMYMVDMNYDTIKSKMKNATKNLKAALEKKGVKVVGDVRENHFDAHWEFSKKYPAIHRFSFYLENSQETKKSFLDQVIEISKSVNGEKQSEQKHDLEYYKKWAMSILDKQKDEPEEEDGPNEETIVKALAYTEIIAKAGYPVGTIREWKGQKYIKIAPNKWKPKYDNMNGRGAKMSLTNLKKAVAKCNSEEELFNLINSNASRFRDENGRPFPEVQELHDLINKRQDEINTPENNVEKPENGSGNENGSDNGNTVLEDSGKEPEKKEKTPISEKISAIQNAGNKGKMEVEKLSQGKPEDVAADAGDDTVNAVKNAAKSDKELLESYPTNVSGKEYFETFLSRTKSDEDHFSHAFDQLDNARNYDDRDEIKGDIISLLYSYQRDIDDIGSDKKALAKMRELFDNAEKDEYNSSPEYLKNAFEQLKKIKEETKYEKISDAIKRSRELDDLNHEIEESGKTVAEFLRDKNKKKDEENALKELNTKIDGGKKETLESLTEKYNATKDPDEREKILNKIMSLEKEKNDTIKDMKEQRKEDLTKKYSETTDPDEREKILNEMMNLDRQNEEKILPAMFDKEDEGFDAWDKDQKAKYGDKSVEELQKLLDTKYKNVKKYTPEYSEAMKIGDMIQQKKRQKK